MVFGSMLCVPGHGQTVKGLYLICNLETSGPGHYKLQQHGGVLKKYYTNKDDGEETARYGDPILDIGIQYRFSRRFALQVGVQSSEMDFEAHDKRFQNNYQLKGGKALNHDIYANPVADQGSFYFPHCYNTSYLQFYYFRGLVYASAGVIHNHTDGEWPKDMTASYLYTPTNENLQMTTHFTPRYMSGFLELGIGGAIPSYLYRRAGFLSLGLRYYLAGNVASADYQDVQNGNILYTDHVSASGSRFSLTLRFGHSLFMGHETRNSIQAPNNYRSPNYHHETHPWMQPTEKYKQPKHNPGKKAPHPRKAKRSKTKAKSKKQNSDTSRGW
jgi:hypothetical protein